MLAMCACAHSFFKRQYHQFLLGMQLPLKINLASYPGRPTCSLSATPTLLPKVHMNVFLVLLSGITTLPAPTVNNVITFLMKENFPAGDAKKLGMLLNIPPGVLNRFVANNPNNHDGVLMDVITYWNDNDEISWDTLSNALKKCGQKEMAAKIKGM